MNLDKPILVAPPIAPECASIQSEIGEMTVCVYMPLSAEVVPTIPASILAVPTWILVLGLQHREQPMLQTLRFSHTCTQWSTNQLQVGGEVMHEAMFLLTALSPPRPVPIPAVREGLPVSPMELASHVSRAPAMQKNIHIPTMRSAENVPLRRDQSVTCSVLSKETAVLSPPSSLSSATKYRVDATGDQGGRQGQDHQDQEGQQQRKHKPGEIKVTKVKGKQEQGSGPFVEPIPGVQEIFIRFMDLMAKILGQAEAEAHELYQKIKHRTDQIDLLTQLIQKINLETKGLDWSNKPELLALVDKARLIGVDVPVGKNQWTEEEKRLFKENIQLRKDSLEKITQLERTDMQRYLQEASQCHQARSNILKLHKEVMDTIIHNLRP